jgi:hypothetical protein
MTRTTFSFGLATILGLMGASQAAASPSVCDGVSGNLVADCGFELATSSLVDWTVSGNTTNPPGGFDGSEYGTAAGDANSGSLGLYAGPIDSPMTISQTLALGIGTEYDISFELKQDAVNPDPAVYTQSFSASLGSTSLVTLLNPPGAGSFVEYSYTDVTATAASEALSFSFQNDDSYWAFDDVVVTAVSSPTLTPEPASFVLTGSLIAMLGFLIARRRPVR